MARRRRQHKTHIRDANHYIVFLFLFVYRSLSLSHALCHALFLSPVGQVDIGFGSVSQCHVWSEPDRIDVMCSTCWWLNIGVSSFDTESGGIFSKDFRFMFLALARFYTRWSWSSFSMLSGNSSIQEDDSQDETFLLVDMLLIKRLVMSRRRSNSLFQEFLRVLKPRSSKWSWLSHAALDGRLHEA